MLKHQVKKINHCITWFCVIYALRCLSLPLCTLFQHRTVARHWTKWEFPNSWYSNASQACEVLSKLYKRYYFLILLYHESEPALHHRCMFCSSMPPCFRRHKVIYSCCGGHVPDFLGKEWSKWYQATRFLVMCVLLVLHLIFILISQDLALKYGVGLHRCSSSVLRLGIMIYWGLTMRPGVNHQQFPVGWLLTPHIFF